MVEEAAVARLAIENVEITVANHPIQRCFSVDAKDDLFDFIDRYMVTVVEVIDILVIPE